MVEANTDGPNNSVGATVTGRATVEAAGPRQQQLQQGPRCEPDRVHVAWCEHDSVAVGQGHLAHHAGAVVDHLCAGHPHELYGATTRAAPHSLATPNNTQLAQTGSPNTQLAQTGTPNTQLAQTGTP